MKAKRANLAKSAEQPRLPQAAEVLTAQDEAESWQLSELECGIKELNEGKGVDHEDVKDWLQSWGKSDPSLTSDHAAFVNGSIFARRFLADFLLVECKSEEESF